MGRRYPPSAWNGSWNVAPENPSATSAICAITRVIGAGRALVASGRATCKRQASGSNPLTGSQFGDRLYLASADSGERLALPRAAWSNCRAVVPGLRVCRDRSAHRRAIRLKSAVKTGQQAQIKLGRLPEEASGGRAPGPGATVARLMDEYAAVAGWDVSTRQPNEGFIRRTAKAALGPMKVQQVRGFNDRYWSRLGSGITSLTRYQGSKLVNISIAASAVLVATSAALPRMRRFRLSPGECSCGGCSPSCRSGAGSRWVG